MNQKKKKRLMFDEAYEDEAHQGGVEFWRNLPRNREHPYGKHPIMAMHGHNLAQSAYDFTDRRTSDLGGHMGMAEQMQMFQTIMQVEAQHKEELEELAKNLTQRIWGIDPNMLNANLGEPGEREYDPGEESDEDVEIPQELRDEINKRITMNALTQGSAVHAMQTAHHMVDQAINDINPTLLNLYNRLSASATHQYWMLDLPMVAEQLLGAVAGTESVDIDDQGNAEVNANGYIFPILVQELFKGVMEVLTMHQLSNKSEADLKQIYRYADRLIDEPFLIQVGPELWRRFLRSMPRGANLANVVAELSRMNPSEVHRIVNLVVEDPDRAREELDAIQ